MRWLRLLSVMTMVLMGSALTRAHDVQIIQGGTVQAQLPPPVLIEAPLERPNVFVHSMQSMVAGALMGSSIGYLTAYDNMDGELARPVLLGTTIGALAGAGFGLSLGLLDLSHEEGASPVRFVARDMLYGTLAGGAIGALGGSIVVLDGGDGDDVLAGAAIGAISGVALGALIGVLESQWRKPRNPRRVVTTIQVSQDQAGHQRIVPSVLGRF